MSVINFRIKALGPVSHGDMGHGDLGNMQVFRRIPRVYDGRPVGVPAISAGSIRGVLRRLLWREVFAVCGLSRENTANWDRLYGALANGGHIEAAEARVTPDRIRARRAALPVLSTLGAALYTSHMAGRARVSNAWVECVELGEGYESHASFVDLLAEESRVRHVDSEEQDPDVSMVTAMPTTIETVIAGAEFCGYMHVSGEIEPSVMAHGLDMVTHLGGKAGQGFGAVEITHDGDGEMWRDRLRDQQEEITASLQELAGELAAKTKTKKKKTGGKATEAALKPAPSVLPTGIF